MDAILRGYGSSSGSGSDNDEDGDREEEPSDKQVASTPSEVVVGTNGSALNSTGTSTVQPFPTSSPQEVEPTPPVARVLKRKRAAKTRQASAVSLPPPPIDFLQAEIAVTEDGDDGIDSVDQNGGRVRTFPHVEGNYASYVYIPVVPDPALRRVMADAMTHARSLCASVPGTPPEVHDNLEPPGPVTDHMPAVDPLHVSLSRTFVLRRHQIDLFVAALKMALRNRRRCEATLQGRSYFINEERTRSFVAVPIVGGYIEVCSLIASVDSAMQRFGLPLFHTDPQPHMTIGWSLGSTLYDLAQSGADQSGQEAAAGGDQWRSSVTASAGLLRSAPLAVDIVECKIGQKVYHFSLRP